MKTRIISGIVMGAIVAAVLVVGYLWTPMAITVAIAFLAVAALYELVCNAAGVKEYTVLLGVCCYAALTVIFGKTFSFKGILTITALYGIYAVIMILINHKDFDLGHT